MTKKKIFDTIKEKVDNIKSACLEMTSKFDIKSVHAFRVEVKKLKSFLQLINAGMRRKSKLRISDSLKKLYNTAGAIRNLQLQSVRLNKSFATGDFDRPKTYLRMIQTELSALRKKAGGQIKGKKFFKRERVKLLRAGLPKVGKKQHKQFVDSTSRQLSELFSGEVINSESLHVARRALKDFLYDFPYIRKNILKAPFGFLDTEKFTDITNMIGKFHDACTSIDMLNEQLDRNVFFEKEKALLLDIRGEWLREKESIQKRIIRELDKVTIPGYRHVAFASST